jgi:hypothetical protein
MKRFAVCGLIFCLAFLPMSSADDNDKQVWNFDDDKLGEIAKGFKGFVGNWVVQKTDDGHVLAQTALNPNSTFNIALIENTSAENVDIYVKMKAIGGDIDRGGGLIWRAQDNKNYFLARYNPLEDNYRLYKVVDGKRTLLKNADISHSEGWHTLRVTMTGDSITCYYDETKYLEHKDDSPSKAGMVGLWTKADAQSQFDELSLKVGN